MFEGGEPFSTVGMFAPRQGEGMAVDLPVNPPAPISQPVAGPSSSRLSPSVVKIDSEPSTSIPSSRRAMKAVRPDPTEGWFVAWNAVLPGVYFGVQVTSCSFESIC